MNEPALVDRIANDPRKYHEESATYWNPTLAITLGAYRIGKTKQWLHEDLGLRWLIGVNLCPPGPYRPELAARFVPHLQAKVGKARWILIGGEVARAYGIEDPHAPCIYAKNMLVLPDAPHETVTKEVLKSWTSSTQSSS